MTKKISSADLFRIDAESAAGQYLRSEFWFPVISAKDLEIGRPKVGHILDTKVTIFRGASGKAYAVGSHCPHRNTSLVSAYVEEEAIRCLYHGWKFDSSGKCLEQPLSGNCRLVEARIESYPTFEYLGLIFIYLGDRKQVPPRPSFPSFEGPGTCYATYVSDWPCNFFTMIEGATDWGHTLYTHRRSGLSNGLPLEFSFQSEECEFGVRTYNTSASEADLTNPTQFYMPCSNFFDVPDPQRGFHLNCMIWRVPTDNNHVRNFIVVHSASASEQFMKQKLGIDSSLTPTTSEIGDDVLSGKLSLDDLLERPDLIQIEDYVAQVGQLGPSVALDCLLTPADSGIRVMREMWMREIQNFVDGKQLKRWRHLVNNS